MFHLNFILNPISMYRSLWLPRWKFNCIKMSFFFLWGRMMYNKIKCFLIHGYCGVFFQYTHTDDYEKSPAHLHSSRPTRNSYKSHVSYKTLLVSFMMLWWCCVSWMNFLYLHYCSEAFHPKWLCLFLQAFLSALSMPRGDLTWVGSPSQQAAGR